MEQQIKKLLEVMLITGLSRSSIYRMGSDGTFPKPIKLGLRSSGWLATEVNQWIADRIALSRQNLGNNNV